MKATRTSAANGLSDHDPNDDTTAVVTGSTSLPATTAAGSGCASVAATAFSSTMAPTLSTAIQIARGTLRSALWVSSAAPTATSKPMKTQPPTARAASNPAPTEPPDNDSAPSVCVSREKPWLWNTTRSVRPTPTDATHSAAIPSFTTRPSSRTPNQPASAASTTSTSPAKTTARGVGSMSKSASAHGAPRYATVVFAREWPKTAPRRATQP